MSRQILIDAIATVRSVIRDFDDYMQDEFRTRVIIIDPILKALGWDVTNPSRVRLEDRENGNLIDYVLMKENNDHFAVVEAKAYRKGIDIHRKQASGYAVAIGARYVILTNGSRWEAWKVVAGSPRRDNMVVEANISTGGIEQVADLLLLLSYERLGED